VTSVVASNNVTRSSLSSWYSATAVASGYGTPVAAAFVDEMFDIIPLGMQYWLWSGVLH